jgi:hypothetical protein
MTDSAQKPMFIRILVGILGTLVFAGAFLLTLICWMHIGDPGWGLATAKYGAVTVAALAAVVWAVRKPRG